MNDDRLAFILRAPALTERIVRGALREALRSRRYRLGALDVRRFANAALAELERIAAATRPDLDALARLELQNAVVNAAGCFASSAVARRLFELPLERLRAFPSEADAAVADLAGNVHLVRLELVASDAARAELARVIERGVSTTQDAARPPQLHLFSLRDGRLRTYATAVDRAETSLPSTLPVTRLKDRRSA